jgi:hypothetical protein
MPIKRKVTIIAVTAISLICILAAFGFRALVSSIRHQRTCEWANIDNIELHAHLDVPKVIKWDCSYDKADNIKKASFTIDKNHVDLDEYIQNHRLLKVNSAAKLEYDRFLRLEKDSLNGSEFFYRKGSGTDLEWYDVLLDKATGRLWVTMKYKH